MRFQGAKILEQGVTFAVVVVKRQAIGAGNREAVQRAAGPLFPGIPIVLMAQTVDGRSEYFGRRDIVQFLAATPVDAIPWRWYSNAT